ncbi:MAG: hypothetical protein Q4C02_09060, partial [Eubacteriales bacterium]|nr:hypothetical protein [Eubacteriales bacterium]
AVRYTGHLRRPTPAGLTSCGKIFSHAFRAIPQVLFVAAGKTAFPIDPFCLSRCHRGSNPAFTNSGCIRWWQECSIVGVTAMAFSVPDCVRDFLISNPALYVFHPKWLKQVTSQRLRISE